MIVQDGSVKFLGTCNILQHFLGKDAFNTILLFDYVKWSQVYIIYIDLLIYSIHIYIYIYCAETCSKEIPVHIAGSFVWPESGSMSVLLAPLGSKICKTCGLHCKDCQGHLGSEVSARARARAWPEVKSREGTPIAGWFMVENQGEVP